MTERKKDCVGPIGITHQMDTRGGLSERFSDGVYKRWPGGIFLLCYQVGVPWSSRNHDRARVGTPFRMIRRGARVVYSSYFSKQQICLDVR